MCSTSTKVDRGLLRISYMVGRLVCADAWAAMISSRIAAAREASAERKAVKRLTRVEMRVPCTAAGRYRTG